MLTALNQLTSDYQDKFHYYDGVTGYIGMFFRLGLYAYFSYGIYETH